MNMLETSTLITTLTAEEGFCLSFTQSLLREEIITTQIVLTPARRHSAS